MDGSMHDVTAKKSSTTPSRVRNDMNSSGLLLLNIINVKINLFSIIAMHKLCELSNTLESLKRPIFAFPADDIIVIILRKARCASWSILYNIGNLIYLIMCFIKL